MPVELIIIYSVWTLLGASLACVTGYWVLWHTGIGNNFRAWFKYYRKYRKSGIIDAAWHAADWTWRQR